MIRHLSRKKNFIKNQKTFYENVRKVNKKILKKTLELCLKRSKILGSVLMTMTIIRSSLSLILKKKKMKRKIQKVKIQKVKMTLNY